MSANLATSAAPGIEGFFEAAASKISALQQTVADSEASRSLATALDSGRALRLDNRPGLDKLDRSVLDAFEATVDVIFLLDILLTFRTGILEDNGSEVTEPRVIAIRYARSWLAADVLAAYPSALLDSSSRGAGASLTSCSVVAGSRAVGDGAAGVARECQCVSAETGRACVV